MAPLTIALWNHPRLLEVGLTDVCFRSLAWKHQMKEEVHSEGDESRGMRNPVPGRKTGWNGTWGKHLT